MGNISDKMSNAEVLQRRALRLAELLRDHMEEGAGFDTRLFHSPFIHDFLVMRGRSTQGVGHSEHIVPRKLIRDECLKMLEKGSTVEEVRDAIVRHLGIVHITPKEAHYLDHVLKLETCMPPSWRFNIDDPMERLKVAGIDVVELEVHR